jgi:hypothetical protein
MTQILYSGEITGSTSGGEIWILGDWGILEPLGKELSVVKEVSWLHDFRDTLKNRIED